MNNYENLSDVQSKDLSDFVSNYHGWYVVERESLTYKRCLLILERKVSITTYNLYKMHTDRTSKLHVTTTNPDIVKEYLKDYHDRE